MTIRTQLRELTEILGRHALEDDARSSLPNVRLTRYTRPTTDHHQFFPPALSIIAQGSILASVGGERLRAYDASTFVVTSLELPTVSRVPSASAKRPYLQLMLSLSADGMAGGVAELLSTGNVGAAGASITPVRRSGSYWVAPTSGPLLESVVHLARLLDEPAAIPFLAPVREREVLYRLLTGAQGARLRTLVAQGGRTMQIATAIELLKSDLGRPLYVEELARRSNMSVTSFHRHFKTLTGLSPVQCQKRLRLQESRRLMTVADAGAAQAALRVGYRSVSQFTRDYRRLYGRPPHRDVTDAAGG